MASMLVTLYADGRGRHTGSAMPYVDKQPTFLLFYVASLPVTLLRVADTAVRVDVKQG